MYGIPLLPGIGTGKINGCFIKYGSMIDIDPPPPPFSAFARWLTRGALLRKGTSTKNVVLTIIFSLIEFGMMLLL